MLIYGKTFIYNKNLFMNTNQTQNFSLFKIKSISSGTNEIEMGGDERKKTSGLKKEEREGHLARRSSPVIGSRSRVSQGILSLGGHVKCTHTHSMLFSNDHSEK